MAGMIPIRIVSFLLLATCTSLCQWPDKLDTKSPLPDAPSAQIPTQERPTLAHDVNAPEFAGTIESKNFFAKCLSPSHSSVTHNGSYPVSASDSLIGRAAYAASSLVLTHDEDGKSRLNTSYLLRVLTSAVAHSAYRPYWKRHISQPFSDFGSTIGNDAGMNVFHEFEPGILQLVKTHEPKFVSNIEEHFHHN
jgi:hypothetical protein